MKNLLKIAPLRNLTVDHVGTMKGSKWDEVLLELTESVQHKLSALSQQDLESFCVENQKTRFAILSRFILNLYSCPRKVCEDFLKLCGRSRGKDSVRALQKKEEGNEKYKKKEYEECLLLYTDSIFHANNNDDSLPLAYANRSLVLQLMGCPVESLVDIDMALNCGYPKEKLEVLLLRKSKCLVQLGEVSKAREVLTLALEKCEKKAFCQLIENELEKTKDLKNRKSVEVALPEPVGGENENFVSASNHISVYYDKSKGRHVVATKDIQVGDVLFVEEPFAFVTLNLTCFNCLKKTVAPIPCCHCSDAFYCSPKCRDDFWKSVHVYECGFAKLFNSVGIAHLSLRIVLRASCSLNKLKRVLHNIPVPEYENGIVLYKSKGYESVYNLVHNSDRYEAKDLFQYIMTALLLASHLKKNTNYFPEVTDIDDLKLLTSVILRHILQLICNGHAVNGVCFKGSKEKWVNYKGEIRTGTAIYTSVSMMNHSCEPSVFICFYKNWLVVRAAKAIRKGEEVFNCYGPHARRMKRASRQEVLSKQYFFMCQCQACSQKFDIQDKFRALKCTNCKGPSVPTQENSFQRICLSCGKTCEISVELARKVHEFYSYIKEGEVLLNSDISLSLKKFLKGWWLGREIFYKFHKDLSNAADEIARSLLEFEDFRRCILFLKCSVRSVEERFGSISLEAANEMKKLGDVIINYVVYDRENIQREIACQGILYYQKAQKIMSLLCGPQYDELADIEKNSSILEELLKSK